MILCFVYPSTVYGDMDRHIGFALTKIAACALASVYEHLLNVRACGHM